MFGAANTATTGVRVRDEPLAGGDTGAGDTRSLL